MYEPGVLSILEDTEVAQAQLDKALVNQVYGGMYIESNWRLLT